MEGGGEEGWGVEGVGALHQGGEGVGLGVESVVFGEAVCGGGLSVLRFLIVFVLL